jgi:hypothetical protein
VREKGKVVEISGSFVRVQVEPSAACKTCPAHAYCRQDKCTVVEAKNAINALMDDEVYIQTSFRQSMAALFFLFVLPVLLGLIGILIFIRTSVVAMVISGCVGFISGLLGAKIIDLIAKKRGYFMPQVVEIVKSENT